MKQSFRFVLPFLAMAATLPALQAVEISLADEIVVVSLRSDDFQNSRNIRQLEQLLTQAEKDRARAVVFDLNVKGTIPWSSLERILEGLSDLTVPTISYVNSTATGAGALVAVGSDTIYMDAGGIIGGAGIQLSDTENEQAQQRELSQQLSLLKARARSLARIRGHRPEIVEAFIDSEAEVRYGDDIISRSGEVLTLTATEATREIEGTPLLARGIARSIEDVLEREKLNGETRRLSPLEFAQIQSRARLQTDEPSETSEGEIAPASDADEEGLFSRRTGESYRGKIVVLEVGQDALSSGKARFDFMDRTLKKAQLDGATAVIFDIDTPGGFAWYTQGLLLNSLQDITVPTYAFVNTRAESAGAIVALGTDHIYMRPAASIGSALIVTSTGGDLNSAMESKQTQMIISVVRNIAELKGHNPDIAEAFVSRDKEVRIGGTVIHEAGEVLNLNTIDATEVIDGRPVLAEGVADSIEQIVAKENLEGEIIAAEVLGMEGFAHWIQKFAFLLIIIGIAGAYLELQTPGFALPGIVSVLAFSLFFFGNYMAGNLAGYELAVLFILGLVLIAVEIFLFPGLIIPSFVGGLLVLLSLGLAMVDRVDLEYKWDGLPGAESWATLLKGSFMSMALGLTGGIVLILFLMRFLPRSRIASPFVLKAAVPEGASIDGQIAIGSNPEVRDRISYLGWEGTTTTDLRPAGKGRFRGETLDVISDGEFIPRGSTVSVVRHEGSRIVVQNVTPLLDATIEES